MSNEEDSETTAEVVTTWTGIYVTLFISILQGLLFYLVFLHYRNRDKKIYESQQQQGEEEGKSITSTACNLYEPRSQYEYKHRSPPPFAKSWWKQAYELSDEETLRQIGLDSYMFLRLLKLGSRICFVGACLSLVLIPVYATANMPNTPATKQFNLLTLAKVEQGGTNGKDSWRLYLSVIMWYIFVTFVLSEFFREWKMYAKHRANYWSHGNDDDQSCRRAKYTVRIEQVMVPPSDQNNNLAKYFDRMFPGQVLETVCCHNTSELEKLLQERQGILLKYESAVAKHNANPDKPKPTIRVKRDGNKKKKVEVDAIEYYQEELARLNNEIDSYRSTNFPWTTTTMSTTAVMTTATPTSASDGNTETVVAIDKSTTTEEQDGSSSKSTSTAFVTFKNLRTKQAVLQCELNGNPDTMIIFPADDSTHGTLWQNIHVDYHRQNRIAFFVKLFWFVGILFWAVPVSFVTSIANLNSILQTLQLKPANPNAAWYGLVSGLLPVIALAILMVVLYMAINAAATSVIKLKSGAQVESYCLFWHMLFQFANLWLIIIGGSLFNQLDAILDDPFSILDVLATALPGASTFFVNMIIVSSFGNFGLELSQLPKLVVNGILACLMPEPSRTQRQLDDAKTPPTIVWGQLLPPIIFIFLVAFLYMPIVPIIEIFAWAYFSGMYIVWKHQCLHVYVQPNDGGGDATWQQVFRFLMACIYIGESVFIAYMGIKEAPIQGGLGFVPLIVTGLFHRHLHRTVIAPIRNLSLEAAAQVDLQDGELVREEDSATIATSNKTKNAYLQPALDPDQDEREPMPYRREDDEHGAAVEQPAV